MAQLFYSKPGIRSHEQNNRQETIGTNRVSKTRNRVGLHSSLVGRLHEEMIRLGRSQDSNFRCNAWPSPDISGPVRAYSRARAGMDRRKTTSTSAIAERRRRSGTSTLGSQATLSTHMSL